MNRCGVEQKLQTLNFKLTVLRTRKHTNYENIMKFMDFQFTETVSPSIFSQNVAHFNLSSRTEHQEIRKRKRTLDPKIKSNWLRIFDYDDDDNNNNGGDVSFAWPVIDAFY